jgi:hypothetical protein
MTKVITRYFESADQAQNARYELVQINRLSNRIVETFENADGLVAALTAQHVTEKTARAYHARMVDGGAVMVVHAGFKPLGVAKIVRQVTAKMGAVDLGKLVEEVDVKDAPKLGVSILEGHPRILSVTRDPSSTNYHMANWPIPLISRRKPGANSLTSHNFHFTALFFPLLDRRKPFTASIFAPHARMANFPIPLISRRKPFTGSIIPRHARMAAFPLPLISRRQPKGRSWIPRHGRMASVPFPLLINGKSGTNALIPGAPRMANFPIPLLSKRKPFTGSIFSRHARMANFPIGLISKRKPFTGSLIPRHGHMANFILPLTVRREDMVSHDSKSGFSFSKWLGIPTLMRR